MAEKKGINVNHDLLDIISPLAIEFNKQSLTFGDNLANILVITAYPPHVRAGWLSRVANMEGVTCSMHITYADPSKLIERITKSITEVGAKINAGGNALMIQRWTQQKNDAETILQRIDQEQENLFYLTVAIMIIAQDKETLSERTRRVESTLAGSKMRGRIASFRQEYGLQAVAPYAMLPHDISDIASRNMPASTIAAAFPFNVSGINDGKGFILGRDKSGGLLLIDLWARGGNRINANITVLGAPGVGKSATVKHIFANEYALGTKIIIIDPEREYKDLCENLDGQWINLGGGSSGGRINPLQVKDVPQDEDEDDKTYESKNGLARHFQSLRTFFKLYLKSLDDMEQAILEEVLEILYENHGITFETDTSKIERTQYPILKDLFDLLNDLAKTCEVTSKKNSYEKLAVLLRRLAVGADAMIWNGHTTVEAKSDFIVLDTYDLNEADEQIKRTQYFNILTWCWHELSQDRDEQVLLGVDEAYLLVDPNVPQSIQFLRNASKRCRKYESGLAVISHSAGDFLSPEVKRYGESLLDNACFKLLMGVDGNALEDVSRLFNLTEAEHDMLAKKKRGEGLLLIGAEHYHSDIEIPDFELELFGKGGGK